MNEAENEQERAQERSEGLGASVVPENGEAISRPSGEVQVTCVDRRPQGCRFRLQDEGKAYPRSSCQACGRSIATGLGNKCNALPIDPMPRQQTELTPLEALALDVLVQARAIGQTISLAEAQERASRLASIALKILQGK